MNTPGTDPKSSATPHMSALHTHLDALREAHGRIGESIDAHVATAAAAHRAKQQPPEEPQS